MQEIICVLDKSGSMQSVRNDAVEGFNAFIEEQQKIGDANLTVVWFDHGFEVGYEGKLSEMKTLESWPSGGMTALTDAIGKTFNHVQDRFSMESPEKVIMAILTDGEENSSKEFDNKAVSELITEHQTKYGWNVIFLAADQDAWSVAQHYGILKENAISYASADTRAAFTSYSQSVSMSR